ncbi:MAG: DNA polymerase III subunit gamma/tau [Bacteroidales bacterium]|nr:DNA polymerase III subunit gamma/tau [Bacteroidales bacterium]
MDDFIVSARKYRPDNFVSVVGQDSITKTLKNSIKTNQLAQAYLFCGPRGVGKTTCARIFAKTINCSNVNSEFEACNECESCVAFNKLRSLNIHELDAASNNSVDDIRNLIDQVRIPPQLGSYSVYIIDEVHMLSSAAFNAFLKTLEEPPKHVVFILATTEKHKIIPTILSRCQIFDFNRIGVDDIRDRLEFVAQKENISAEHDALQIIAQKADGAMRDALSIFDQIVSFSGKDITYQSTIKNLNVLDYEIYFDITNAFITANYSQSLLIFDDVIRKGFEANYFITGLASHFRDLLICKDPGTVELLEVGKKIKEKYLEHAQKCSVSFLFQAIGIANNADLNYKASQNKRLLVELALLSICNIENEALINNIEAEKPVENKKTEQKSEVKPEHKFEVKPVVKEKAVSQKTVTSEDTTTQMAAPVEPVAEKPMGEELENIKTANTQSESSTVQKSVSENKPSYIGVSIKDITKSTEKIIETDSSGEPIISYEHLGTDDYDEEKLQYVWEKYAESKSADPRLNSFLKTHAPVKDADNQYSITVENNQIKAKLEAELMDTLKFLKTELNNSEFELSYKVGTTEQEKTFKSDQEKLEDMIKQNPEVKNLRDQLNLDFE